MADIVPAFQFTMRNEGAYVDHPKDRGGATKFGVTIFSLARWRGRAVRPEDVQALTIDDALAFYTIFYWRPMNLAWVNDQEVASCLFDISVLRGTGQSAKYAQKVTGSKLDEIMGPLTVSAVNKAARDTFIPEVVSLLETDLRAIVANDPSQNAFLNGWLNRCTRLRALV